MRFYSYYFYLTVTTITCLILWTVNSFIASHSVKMSINSPEKEKITSDEVNSSTVNPSVSNEEVSQVNPIEPLPMVILRPSIDLNRTLFRLDLWGRNSKCNAFDVSLLDDHSLPPRALVSFPGSGNSWLRMLVMGLTGIYVDSVYSPPNEFFRSKVNGSKYKISKDCGCTLLQKTHDFSLFGALQNYTKLDPSNSTGYLTESLVHFRGDGILVIRNPFKAIIAYRNFVFGGMSGMAPRNAFETNGAWDRFVTWGIISWETLATTWIRGLKRGGIVYYERMQNDTEAQLLRMVELMGVPYVDKERLQCVLRHNKDNSFKRKKIGHNATKSPFTEGQRLLILQSIENVQKALKERQLDPLPVDLYEYYSSIYEYGLFDRQ